MKLKPIYLVLLTLILGTMLVSCGKKEESAVNVGPPPITVMGQEVDWRALASQVDNYRQVGITQYENPMVKLYFAYEAAVDEYVTGASDIMAIGKHCINDQAEAQAFVVNAALGDMNQEGMFNALVTDNVTGAEATADCVEIYQDLADYSMAHRAGIKDAKLALVNMSIDYETYFTQWIAMDVVNDLLQVYGDSAVIYQQLESHGVELPGTTDITWLPTDLLRATHSDEGICQYYMSGDFVNSLSMGTRMKFKDNPEGLAMLFETTWIPPEANGGTGLCTMTRWAAIRWYQRMPNSAQAREVFEQGNAPLFENPEPLND